VDNFGLDNVGDTVYITDMDSTTTKGNEMTICNRTKWAGLSKSPVCKKAKDHDGAHKFDVNGAWAVRNERGQYIVEAE
jgi:hypothetical protein